MRIHDPSARASSATGLALVLAVSFSACSTTRIDNSWVERTATPQSFALSKVVVVALVSDGALRRVTEDAMDDALTSGPRGIAGQLVAQSSYALLEDRDLGNADTARLKIEQAGYDGAVLLTFISSKQRVTVDPPSYGGGFYGHYGYGRGAMVYDPGSVRTDTILKLQISIYSLTENKLLWSGMSSSLNPSKIEKLVVDVAAAVRKDLDERGLAP